MSSPGRGDPGRSPPAEIAEVKALASELPAESGRALSRSSAAELAREAVARGIVCEVSGTTVWLSLSDDAIRPWAWRSWVFPRDPDFREKAGRVLDLYERRWEGRRLHPGEYVISADEKTQLQALPQASPARRARSRAARAGRARVPPPRTHFDDRSPRVSNAANSQARPSAG